MLTLLCGADRLATSAALLRAVCARAEAGNRKNRLFPEKKLQKQVLKIQRPLPKILSQRQSFWPVSITMTKLSIF